MPSVPERLKSGHCTAEERGLTFVGKTVFSSSFLEFDFVFVRVSDLQVLLDGSKNRYILSNLRPSTEYEVMLTAVFRDEFESDTVSVVETTCTYKRLFGPLPSWFPVWPIDTSRQTSFTAFSRDSINAISKIRPPSSSQPRSMANHLPFHQSATRRGE